MVALTISPKMNVYGPHDLDKIPQLSRLGADDLYALKVVSHVLPFKTNDYVTNQLIDWDLGTEDPLFKLTFMQKDMIAPAAFEEVSNAMKRESSPLEMAKIVARLRHNMNPHPSANSLTTFHPWTGPYSKAFSTSTVRPFLSSRQQVRPALPTAPFAFAGPSLSAIKT